MTMMTRLPIWLWGGLGLLSTAGVAYALDDDNDSVAAPTFAGRRRGNRQSC
jgi:hypothetical protein